MSGELPTPASTLRADYVRVRLDCRSRCAAYPGSADLQKLIDAGQGDTPLVKLRWRCAECGSRLVNAMVAPKRMTPKSGQRS